MKLSALLIALLVACSLYGRNLPEAVYLMGEMGGWQPRDEYRFARIDGQPVYTLKVASLDGAFKIADPTWTEVNFGGCDYALSSECKVDFGDFPCVRIGRNFVADKLRDVVLTFDFSSAVTPVLRIEHAADYEPPVADSAEPSAYYLRGSLHGFNWECREQFRFMKTDREGVFMLELPELYGDFKISNEDWSENFGCSALCVGSPVTLVPGGQNMHIATVRDAVLTLDLSDAANPTLTIVGDDTPVATEPSGIYLQGDMHDCLWEAEYKYEFRHQPGSDIYTLDLPVLYDTFKIGSPGLSAFSLGNDGDGVVRIDGFGKYGCREGGNRFYVQAMTDVRLTLDLTDKTSPTLEIAKDAERSAAWKEGYETVYREEFDGADLNAGRWTALEGGATWDGCLSRFTAREANLGVHDSALTLTARREPFGDADFTSAGVVSRGKLLFRYGKLDIKMRQPSTDKGLFLALWLLGYHDIWPQCGEMDIIEHGLAEGIRQGITERYFSGSCFWPSADPNLKNNGYTALNTVDYPVQDGEYHLYTMYWDAERIAYYLDEDKYPDREPYFVMLIPDSHPDDPGHPGNYYHWPFYIYIHLAVQQLGEGVVMTSDDVTALNDANGQQASMSVDYVRISQKGAPGEMLIADTPSDTSVSSVESVETAPVTPITPTAYYDLLGRPVANPTGGIYVRLDASGQAELIRFY